MICISSSHLPNKKYEVISMISAESVRCRNIIHDIGAFLRSFFGGEIIAYSELVHETSQHAIDVLIRQAEELGADAIINIRFQPVYVRKRAAELYVYGTAVKFIEVQ